MMRERMALARRAIEHWKKAAGAIGVVQTRFIMLAVYLVAVLPVGLVFRVRRDPLHLRQPAGSNWTPCREDEATLERARQQF
jgi:hypothetical protein